MWLKSAIDFQIPLTRQTDLLNISLLHPPNICLNNAEHIAYFVHQNVLTDTCCFNRHSPMEQSFVLHINKPHSDI